VVFLLVQVAVLWLEGGEFECVWWLVDEIVLVFGDLLFDVDWLLVVCKVCEAVVGSGWMCMVMRCVDLLVPYVG